MTTAAVIGCGKVRGGKEGWAIGHAHGEGYRSGVPDVQLYAVDPDPANRSAFGEKFNVPDERLFASTEALYAAVAPDMVSICTWPKLHRPQVIEAAEAGVKAIVCEKPLACDGSEIDDMLSAVQSAGARLFVAHQRRYNAVFEAARKALAEGVLGAPVVVEARVGDGWDMLSWTVHWFDMAAYVLDDQPVTVIAGIDQRGNQRYQHAVEDASVVFATYGKGHQGIFITGPDAPFGTTLMFRGSDGEMRLTPAGLRITTAQGVQERAVPKHDLSDFARLLADVAEAAASQRPQPLRCETPAGALGTRMALAAQEASRTRRAVDMKTFRTGFAPLDVLQHTPTLRRLVQRAILLGDPHHRDPVTGLSGREGLAEALGHAVAETVEVVPIDERELTEADLQACDLLVIYHTCRNSSPSARRIIGRYVEAGRPLLVSHCGIGAYADWPEYRQWVGRHWVWDGEEQPPSGHPHQACRLIAQSTLDVPWSEAWLPRDEVYIRLAEAGEIEVAATMQAEGIDEPAIWRSAVRPNVAASLPGHRYDIWQLGPMRDQLRAAVMLAQEKAPRPNLSR